MGASASRMQEGHSRQMVTRLAATATALALLTVPVPTAGADGPSRTVLIAASESLSLSALAEQVGRLGGRVVQTLGIADSLLVEMPAGVGAPAGSAEVPDVPMRVNGAQAQSTAPLPTYRDTIGASGDLEAGAGTTIALVDTGVSTEVTFIGSVDHVDVSGAGAGTDGLGHGTFLAGLIVGTQENPGVAPGADLLDVKVADDEGNTSLSRVLTGLQIASDQAVDVVNLSLSTDSPMHPAFDPLSRALDNLWDAGITVVTSAGNDGPHPGSVTSPGDNPLLITVGGLDEAATADRADDSVADFSSRGTQYGASKPDLVAPGSSVISTVAPGSEAQAQGQDNGSLVGDGYMRGSGTSMSAAVVSGAVAVLLQANDDLTPNGVKALLTSTTYSNDDLETGDGAGHGALDLAAAVAAAPDADVDAPQPRNEGKSDRWGPDEADAAAWSAFADAWESGDLDAVRSAWAQLSPATRVWAARAWAMAVVLSSLAEDDAEFEARAWSARAWSADEWLARAWSARAWSARAWSYEEWLARAWSARAWSADEWLARAWSARAWSMGDWAARAWSARAWSARAWSARAWSARAWSDEDWSARAWSDEEWAARAWSARAWSARAWSARAWSDEEWAARAWSARAWSGFLWDARAWSARAWSARAWALMS